MKAIGICRRLFCQSVGKGIPSVGGSASGATAAALNARMGDGLTSLLGFRVDSVSVAGERAVVKASMEVTPKHLAPNGYCHAASIIALGDSACGAGAFMTLPKNAVNFTTATIMSSHMGTATSGTVTCEAVASHLGRTTQLWDATVRDAAGKKLALLRVTQILLQNKE